MPNTFAYLALFCWPLVALVLFRLLPRSQAVAWTIIGGYLALPYGVGINPPVLPTFDKVLVPALSAAVLGLLGAGRPELTLAQLPGRRSSPMPDQDGDSLPQDRPAARFTRQTARVAPRSAKAQPVSLAGEAKPERVPLILMALLLVLILNPFLTVLGNGNAYPVGDRILPGLGLYDAFSEVLDSLVMVVPFFLGLVYLGRPERHAALLRIFCLAGLTYSLPTLFEIRMSPQLSRWTYGFLAQSFEQAMRDGGFRPVVFLQHGLWLAIFLAMTALAAFALWRQVRVTGPRDDEAAGRSRDQSGAQNAVKALLAGLWLSGVLFLCHSLGGLGILMVLAPVVLLASVRVQMLVALAVTLVMLGYPMLRGAGLVPVQGIVDTTALLSADRAASMKFRFDNEDILLAHANQHPFAGWGGFGRSRVYSTDTGKDLSVTDGIWIIVMGTSGWFGYLATFGLLATPVLILALRRRKFELSFATAGLCLMMAANMTDMIPNATMTPLTWLIAGALAGRCRFPARVQEAVPDQGPPRAVRPSHLRLRRPSGVTAATAARRLRSVVAALLLALGAGPVSADSAVPAGIGLTNPSLAFGLTGISDWSTEQPFLDLMKSARPWIGHKGNTWNAMTYQDLLSGGYLDAQGWPKAIPQGLTSIGTIWSWGNSVPSAAASRAGTYVLTYRGEGALTLGGDAQILSSRPGMVQFRNTKGGMMTLAITATDPKHLGDYLRDIVIVPERYVALRDAGEFFNPDWLALIADARVVRFMDWMTTNGTTHASWEDRPKPDDANWVRRGVPVEVMVQLANQIGAEPWFNMPAGADDAYNLAFATYVRDHLNHALTAHVEYSNETWNWLFAQTNWMATQAKAVWGTADKAAYIDYNAMVATRSALIWREVFAAQAKARLDLVLASQTGNAWGTTRLLTAPLWQRFDPSGYVSPASVFNSLAVTTYFGGATMSKPDLRAELLAVLKDPGVDATDWLLSKMQDPGYAQSLPQTVNKWRASKEVARTYGLKLVAYEGGQHLLQGFGIGGMSDQDQAKLAEFLSGFVRSPAMAELYQQLWTAWAGVGDGPFMQFTDVDLPSKWGAWGLFATLDDHNPRADLLMKLNAATPAWFGTGGTQFQHGVIRLAGDGGGPLLGTDRDDFLIGGAGDDTITPGKGHDVIYGGPGTDTVVLSGAPQDYRLARQTGGDAERSRLTGPQTDLDLHSIERFSFASGITRTPGDMRQP